jgi:hypothetical protein
VEARGGGRDSTELIFGLRQDEDSYQNLAYFVSRCYVKYLNGLSLRRFGRIRRSQVLYVNDHNAAGLQTQRE